MRLSAWARLGVLALALGLFGCDHATKVAAKSALSDHGLPLIDGVLELRFVPNTDIAFSALHALALPAGLTEPHLLAAGAGVALAVVLTAWALAWQRGTLRLGGHAGYALVVAGALGNIVDRLARGYVVDFIHLTHWPVFNVADIAITLGAGLLLGSAIWRSHPAPAVS